jgi:hypothetical protein
MRTAELTELDQLYLHLDREDKPWSGPLEVRVDGALDGNFVVDTAMLSNLGRLDAVPGGVREVWFSPPGRMPLRVSVGAATLHGRLFLTLRYRRALFDPDAAAAFGRVYRDVLLPADREPQTSPA